MLEFSLVGQQFGNYKLIKRIGTGGFAEVYYAEHIHVPDQVAVIKILIETEYQDRFLLEAKIAMGLHGLNTRPAPLHIVQVIDYGLKNGHGVRDDIPYLIMEYAPNGTLRQRHPRGTRVPLPTIVTYVKQLAKALQYAHEKSVIHRDIKPENMLLNSNDEILLSDFGIAVEFEHTPHDSTPKPGSPEDHICLGTPIYMAGERFDKITHRASDQYSVAIVVYEWLCGQPPFQGSSPFEIARQHRKKPVPSIRHQNPSGPPAVEAVVMRALAKKPEERFASVQEFADALEKASRRPKRMSRRHLVIAGATGTIFMILAGLGGEVLLHELASTGPTLVYTYKGHKASATAAAWSPRGLVASGDEEGFVHIWDISGKTRKVYHPHHARVTGISWFPDGKRIATTSKDSTLRVWDAQSGKEVLKPYPSSPIPYSMLTVAWSTRQENSPTSEHLAVSKGRVVLIFDSPIQYNGYAQLDYTYDGHSEDVYAVAWTPDPANKIVASASADNTVQVWNVDTGKRLVLYTGHTDDVFAVAWSPDGKLIASGSRDQTVQVWDAATGTLHFIREHLPSAVNAVAWLPSKHGRYLVCATADGLVEIWDVDSKRQISVYRGHVGSVNALTTSPDGSIASGGDDKTVQVWEL